MSYAGYLAKLESAAQSREGYEDGLSLSTAWHYSQARKFLEAQILKEMGIFFTGEEVSALVASKVRPYITPDTVIIDPACGAGDLLLACAKHLPVSTSLATTLSLWGEMLAGVDINEDFVRATKARLVLLARELATEDLDLDVCLDSLFRQITVGDGLEYVPSGDKKTVVIMNPPYSPMKSPTKCQWADGNITAAAAFLARYIEVSPEETRFVAILPEVLRSGSRYEKWRRNVTKNTTALNKEVLGRFSTFANVDVFLLEGEITRQGGNNGFNWWYHKQPNNTQKKIGDLFTVNVGTVVPHRDEEHGPIYPYIYPRIVPPGALVEVTTSFRRFDATVYTPPFIAVRRTSAPKDDPRCVASIINVGSEVAVENHFIVLKPKNGSLQLCRTCLDVLSDQRSTDWINERIKCRHLTVSSINDLPWWEEEL